MNKVAIDNSAYGNDGSGLLTYNINWHVDWACGGLAADPSACAICAGLYFYQSNTSGGPWTSLTTDPYKPASGVCGNNVTSSKITTLTGLQPGKFYYARVGAAPKIITNGTLVCDPNANNYTQSSVVYFNGDGT